MTRHLHIGAGAFGLGFVAWLGFKSRLDVVCASRLGDSGRKLAESFAATKGYEIETFTGTVEHVELSNAVQFTLDNDDAVLDQVRCNEPLIITTAITERGVQELAKFMVKLLDTRIDSRIDQPTYVVLCENNTHAGIFRSTLAPEVQARIGERVQFLPSVVDRVCAGAVVEPERRTLQVHCEDHAEIVIETPAAHRAPLTDLFKYAPPDTVHLVDDIKPFRIRKLCMLNGAHKVLSLFALHRRHSHFDEYVSSSDGSKLLAAFLKEAASMVDALCDGAFDHESLMAYAAKIEARLRKNPDDVLRLVQRLKNMESVPSFVEDFQIKIGRAALQYMEMTGEIPSLTGSSLLVLGELILDRRFVPSASLA